MENQPTFYSLDTRWQVKYCVLEEELKQQVFNHTFLYFMMNISGGGIAFLAGREVPVDSIIVLDLETSMFPSSLIAIGQVTRCESAALTDEWGFHVDVMCWWMGWKNQGIQEEIAQFILNCFRESGAPSKCAS